MKQVLPGATVGVLGSGQLGRMFAIAARRMGYRVQTFSPDYDTPTGQIADVEVSASYDDLDAVRDFARAVDVITFEFENVPAATAAACAEHSIVRPAGEILHITQNRIREKKFLSSNGFPVARHFELRNANELTRAMQQLQAPGIVKTAGWGYDGKGQARVQPDSDLAAIWDSLKTNEAVLEEMVDFECEASVIVAGAVDGSVVAYPMTRNDHRNHILDISVAPSGLSERVQKRGDEIARAIAQQMKFVGVLCVEMFITRNEEVIVNELAPRPHNSGHWTFDGCATSQFEQQLRAVCGLPLGSTEQLRPAAMANLLGDLWSNGEPDWAGACSDPRVKLHLYGKTEPRAGRKMGHLTALAATTEEARAAVVQAREALTQTLNAER